MANLGLDNFFNSKESKVSDLDWLQVDLEDYNNLPFDNTPEYISVPKLEQAWNHTDDRNSFNLVPNVEMDFNYKGYPSKENDEINDVSKLVNFLKLQMMSGKKGSELRSILKERTHPEIIKLAFEEIKKLSNELGLLGNVYVDPTLFKKCEEGAEFVSKRAKTARYVSAMDKCSGCSFNKQGRCDLYKKHIAKEISYDQETLNFYSKHFSNIVGKEVKISSRKELQEIFSKEETKKEKIAEFKPSLNAKKEETLKEKEDKFKEQLEDFQNSLKNIVSEKISKEIGYLLNKGYSSDLINKHVNNKYSKEEILENKKSIISVMGKQGSLGKVYIDAKYLPIDICQDKNAKEFFNTNNITAKYILSSCNKSNCACRSISSKKIVASINEIPSYVWENEFKRYNEEIKNKLASTFEENPEKGLRLASIQNSFNKKVIKSEPVKENFNLTSNINTSEYEPSLKKEVYFDSKKVSAALSKGFTLSKIFKTAKNLGVEDKLIYSEFGDAFRNHVSSIKKYQLDIDFKIPENVKVITSGKDISRELDNFDYNNLNLTSASVDAPYENMVSELNLKEADLDSTIKYNSYDDLNISGLDEFNI
jgi:hypothetical protein